MTKKMKQKMHVRDSIVDFVQRIERFLRKFDPTTHVLQVQSRLDKLDDKWIEFEDIQAQIEEMEELEENVEVHRKTRAEFEELYFRVRAELKSKLPSESIPSSSSSIVAARSVGAAAGIQLPKISLPEFKGDFDGWLPFYDTFKSLIHENQNLVAIQKFHYLRASLKGEALKIVEAFTLSEVSYGAAWSALVKRYANPYLQKKRHVNALLQYSRLKKPTAAGIHDIIDCFERHTKILDQLGEVTSGWGTMLTQLLVSKLDDSMQKEWEEYALKKENPNFAQLMEFLEGQTRILDAVAVDQFSEIQCSSQSSSSSPAVSKPTAKLSVNSASEKSAPKCLSCGGPHYISACPSFEEMALEKRFEVVNGKKLCSNCLRRDHMNRDCSSRGRCRTCSRKHHSLLHPGFEASGAGSGGITQDSGELQTGSSSVSTSASVATTAATSATTSATPVSQPPQQSTVASIYASNIAAEMREAHVFLSTVLVLVKDCNGRLHTARALLDSGSQANLISERLCQLLKLPRKHANIPISGVGNALIRVNHAITATVSSRISDYSVPVEFLVLKKVAEDQPTTTIPVGNWNLPADMDLADPDFNKRGPIDLLLGLEFFFEFLLVTNGRMQIQRVGEHLPLFVNTVFGWIAAGKADLGSLNPIPSCHLTTSGSLSTLEQNIEKFWALEEPGEASQLTQEEQDCEDHYKANFCRDSEGRYVVRLPKQAAFEKMIGGSRDTAVRRLLQLERRLEKNDELRKRYNEAMQAYLDLGYMVMVSEKDLQRDKRLAYHLPHHPVIKESSATTKIRPVFNASAKTTSNYSLNDALLTGPVIQDTLFVQVLRFRKYIVALVADIEKMYLQIKVHPDDTPLQRIVWRFSPFDNIATYEMLRVTFGLAPSSFLAIRSLQQLAHDEGEHYPRAKAALLNDFYVDDFIGGAESEQEALLLRQELEQLMPKGGFRLRKWVSNASGVLSGIAADDLGTSSTHTFDQEQVKTLGVYWQPGSDQLGIDVAKLSSGAYWTRRLVYSVIAKLFDPAGIIAPVIAWAKIRMQLLWVANQGWDAPVSEKIATLWTQFYEQLPLLANVKVNRCAFLAQPYLVQFHVFVDASEAAYGACVYVRTINQEGQIKVELLAAKSRPAPLKRISLARLELCAAHLGAKLHCATAKALDMEVTDSWFWSDSTVTLAWLKSPPYVWPTFVANRVSHVQQLTKGYHWNHVKGAENPADLVSRGMMPKELVSCWLWFHGPDWLALFDHHWNTNLHYDDPPEELLERKRTVLTVAEPEAHPLLDRFSCYWKLLRVTAYCMRFARNCQRRRNPHIKTNLLTVGELHEAKIALVRYVQRAVFAAEIKEIVNHRRVAAHSPLKLLNPVLDSKGVLRVGGRLSLAKESFSVRHPMILPGTHSFTRQIAVACHKLALHGGPRMTLAEIRQEFWPLRGRQLATTTYRNCIRCFRSNPSSVSQPPGQYPLPRTTPARPFYVTGVDYCGPVYLKPVHRRAAARKAYIAVFVCFSTKAVHLELVSDLTTDAFLAALRRFIARRNSPAEIHSDNGLNFQGARNALRELYDLLRDPNTTSSITAALSERNITWKFIPPRTPNFGGLWEAAVKSTKMSLVKVLGQQQLSFEDMTTVLTQIEAALNSRPLTPMSEDPDEVDVLTPGHFLTGASLHSIPDPDYTDVPMNRLRHYQQLQQMVQQYWKRWRREYLTQLHNQNQRAAPTLELKAGQMVILKEDNKAAIDWPLARIVEVYPGPDGAVRVVKLRMTNRSEFTRGVSRICLLPFERETVQIASNACNPQPSGATPKDKSSSTLQLHQTS